MKKILIVGAGRDQVPAIKMAKEMGYFVIASDLNPNAPGFEFANKSYVVSTNDYEGNLKIATNDKIDGILTLISETAVPVVGRICDKLNLPGYCHKKAIAATNKNEMHRIMEQAGVPMPGSVEVSNPKEAKSAIENFSSPWVIKPSDSSGQRGVEVFDDPDMVETYFHNAVKHSTDNHAIVEEFIEGPEINVTTVVIDGKVHILSLSDRVTLKTPYFGIAVKHIAPPNISETLYKQVEDVALKASNALGLENGITYPQIIANPNGAKLLEIAIRIPGGNMRELALYKSGVDLIEVAIRQAMGETFSLSSITKQSHKAVFIYHYTELDIENNIQYFNSLSDSDEVLQTEGVQEINCFLKKGDIIPKLNWSGGRFASIIITSETISNCLDIFKNAYAKLKVK